MHIIIFISTVNILMLLITYFYYRQNLSFARGWSFALYYLFFAINNILSRILPESLPAIITRWSAWLGGIWMAFAYYSLILAFLHLLLWTLAKCIGKKLPSKKIALAGMLCIACFITFGMIRAYNPIIRTEAINTNKLAHGENYKIVFLSDLHLGRILGRSYSERLVERVNQLNPDIVLIAGDVLDEKQSYVRQDASLFPFTQLNAPKGVYMAYGNHDYLDNPSIWQAELTKHHINVLRNSSVIINKQLKITGLEDYSKEKDITSLEQLSIDNSKYYSIILDHQPRRMVNASAAGYDLYLAGHTHTGQLFPNRLITKKMYLLDYGSANFGNLTAITNNGYGFWGTPIRTEEAPEIVVIDLIGTNK